MGCLNVNDKGEIPIEREGCLYLDGSFEVVAEFFSDFVCEAVAELGEDVFVEDGPYEFVVEIGGAFCSGGAWSFAILDIEEAEV